MDPVQSHSPSHSFKPSSLLAYFHLVLFIQSNNPSTGVMPDVMLSIAAPNARPQPSLLSLLLQQSRINAFNVWWRSWIFLEDATNPPKLKKTWLMLLNRWMGWEEIIPSSLLHVGHRSDILTDHLKCMSMLLTCLTQSHSYMFPFIQQQQQEAVWQMCILSLWLALCTYTYIYC